ncbi:MAG: S41 family peptidase [Bacteroidaceae bacterium]|nr:S41 family peptidase [Bacteroidaceae bacterium]
MKKILTYTLLLLTLTGCIKEDSFDNDPIGNFDALWSIIDQHYCFFDYAEKEYGLDWDAAYDNYRPMVSEETTNEELFDILGNLLAELRDGHVNLSSAYGTTYYWDWSITRPINFSDSIQRNYLGTDFRYNNGIKFQTLLPDSIGYMYVSSFSNSLGSGNISHILAKMGRCPGLIIDIRGNGGGMITSAETLASHFTDREASVGYMLHKTGIGHNDFSQPEEMKLKPAKGAIWLRPTVVLTNGGVYSAANNFVMMMQALPNPYIAILGDKTGGGSGMPLNSTLPNGWRLRYSACPMLDVNGNHTEFGIEPDIRVDLTSEDWDKGRDTMIEAARQYIKFIYQNLENSEKEEGETIKF